MSVRKFEIPATPYDRLGGIAQTRCSVSKTGEQKSEWDLQWSLMRSSVGPRTPPRYRRAPSGSLQYSTGRGLLGSPRSTQEAIFVISQLLIAIMDPLMSFRSTLVDPSRNISSKKSLLTRSTWTNRAHHSPSFSPLFPAVLQL